LVLQVIAGPILEAARHGGYVLDGFPRTLRQAEEAYRMAQQIEGIELQAVVHIKVSRDELRRRLLGRAGQEGRADDRQATIDHRLRVYAAETAPLLDFYARRGLIVEVNAGQHPDKVFADVVAAVDALEAQRPGPG
jgi:adenylate kinase